MLLVDASGRSRSPTRRDVPVLTSIINSPVKVICHSPHSKRTNAQQSARTSGHTAQAAKVKVDSVPSVNILDAKEMSPSEQSKGIKINLFSFLFNFFVGRQSSPVN